jgi:hypothetical protein
MSAIVTDPRCPKHPGHQVYLSWQSWHDWGQWVCSACRRPLGLAARSGICGGRAPWPQGRTQKPRDMATDKVDWDWVFAEQERRSNAT